MIVVAPFPVAMTTASITAFVPLANFSNSNTPTGLQLHHVMMGILTACKKTDPFHTMVLARLMVAVKLSMLLGPQSSPIHPFGIPESAVAAPTY